MRIFDTHAHYDDEAFDTDREDLLKALPGSGIEYVVNVGASIATTRSTLELSSKYDYIYAAVGVHPSDIADLNEESFSWLKEQTGSQKVVAVGEIGLDYYWDKEKEVQAAQQEWFKRQLELAREAGLPVIIHSRDAAKDSFDIMKEMDAGSIGGVVHCYSYSPELAAEYVKMGLFIGVGGVVTFSKAKKLKETVAAIPMDNIVIETDCPYLAPVPYRGKRNSSLNLPLILAEIASIKGISEEEAADITFANAMRLYHL